jgi:CBS domain-containing protein
MDEKKGMKEIPVDTGISDDDIYAAMKDMQGYLDITPADLKEIYTLAFRHALERITRFVKARDIMTKQVFFVKRDSPLSVVAELMAERNVSGVPVLDDKEHIAGMISEKDFLTHMGARDKTHFMSVVAEYLKGKDCLAMTIRGQNAEDIMTLPAITVEEHTAVSDIAALFAEKNINRVPVINRAGFVIGIISRADIVRAATVNAKAEI